MSDNDISLGGGKLSLAFQVRDDHLLISSISDGRCEFVGPGIGQSHSLWNLKLASPDGRAVEIESGDAALSEAIEGRNDVRFDWSAPFENVAVEVSVTVAVDGTDGLSYWSLKAAVPDGWQVTRADFPILPNVKLQDGLKTVVPSGWGIEYDVNPGMAFQGVYPSCLVCMQFAAFYRGEAGLYIGAHDAEASHKQFSISAGEDAVEFRLTNWPALSDERGGTFELEYPAVVGVFDGGYYEAARIYRRFTFETTWGSAGEVSERDIPAWLKETDLWLRPDGSPEANLEVTKEALSYFDVPTSLHWYRWHVIPYDTLYPDYFPPLPGFSEAIAAFQDAGSHVMPYINGRLCDPESDTWNVEGARKFAARDEDGNPYTEVYGSKVPLNVMCPYTGYWQEKIEGLVRRLVSECGVNGVYIDQIGAAYAVRCFDKSHGHPIGGGSFWYHGYRKLLDRVRTGLPEDVILTTEENAECWIDQFDALLLVNTPTGSGRFVPLFPAVYSGRAITFGFLYYPPDDLERSLPFLMKTALGFLWGAQLGWIQPARIMAPEARMEAEFLRTLARCRRFAHQFVAYGRFLGSVVPEGNNPEIVGEGSGSFGGSYSIAVPSVLGSAWAAQDGELGVLLVNLSEQDREVTVTLPLGKVGLDRTKPLTLKRFGPDGLESTIEGAGGLHHLAVGARAAAVLAVSVSGPS